MEQEAIEMTHRAEARRRLRLARDERLESMMRDAKVCDDQEKMGSGSMEKVGEDDITETSSDEGFVITPETSEDWVYIERHRATPPVQIQEGEGGEKQQNDGEAEISDKLSEEAHVFFDADFNAVGNHEDDKDDEDDEEEEVFFDEFRGDATMKRAAIHLQSKLNPEEVFNHHFGQESECTVEESDDSDMEVQEEDMSECFDEYRGDATMKRAEMAQHLHQVRVSVREATMAKRAKEEADRNTREVRVTTWQLSSFT